MPRALRGSNAGARRLGGPLCGIEARRLYWVSKPGSFKATVEYAILAQASGAARAPALLLRAQGLDAYQSERISGALAALLKKQAPQPIADSAARPRRRAITEDLSKTGIRRQLPAKRQACVGGGRGPAVVCVVVPVYGQPEALQVCLESVVAAKNKTAARVLLVDDASPDPRIALLLEHYGRHHGVQAISRPSNGGFSAAVNSGIAAAGGCDVVLLNSDTCVSDGWLDKLRDCAYQDAQIAGACALSNNAELLSVPQAMQATPMPSPEVIAAINLFLERNKGRASPLAVPSGVGFCWYLKASTIARVGLFDEALISGGYGEDTEYSVRIAAAGLLTVAACDTFVGHTGSQSFGLTKRVLAAQNNRRLAQLFAEHFFVYEQFVFSAPNQALGERLQEFLIAEGHLPRCPVYRLAHWQWDYLTRAFEGPAIGLVRLADDGSAICGHRVPGLHRLVFKRQERSRYERVCALLTKTLGNAKSPYGPALLGSRGPSAGLARGFDAQPGGPQKTPLRIAVPYLRTASSGFFKVTALASAIAEAGAEITLTVIGPTVCDRVLARHRCVELAGGLGAQRVREQLAHLNCSALLITGARPLAWEQALAREHGLALITPEAVFSLLKKRQSRRSVSV